MKNKHDGEQGQAIVILALMMIGLLAFAALAIDGGNTYNEKRKAQNAADAGALAGARQLWVQLSNGISDESGILFAMNSVAKENGVVLNVDEHMVQTYVFGHYTDKDGNPLGTNLIGTTGSIPPNAFGVQVIASRNFNTFIAGLIGRGEMNTSAQATAVIIPPTGCGGFAIYAVGDINNPINNLSITGGGQGITIHDGGTYSGGNTHIQNTTIAGGTVDSGGTCGPAQQCSGSGADAVNNGAGAPNFPPWDINDFKPGGPVAAAVGSTYYHYINGNMNDFDASVPDGVYYVTGDVMITGGSGTHQVTIVSEGTQKYTANVNLYAYFHDLLFFSNSTNQTNGAIQLSGSNLTWQGLIYAPKGDVNMSAASNSNVNGAIYGVHVSLSGAGININYDPAACPPTRARVILFK